MLNTRKITNIIAPNVFKLNNIELNDQWFKYSVIANGSSIVFILMVFLILKYLDQEVIATSIGNDDSSDCKFLTNNAICGKSLLINSSNTGCQKSIIISSTVAGSLISSYLGLDLSCDLSQPSVCSNSIRTDTINCPDKSYTSTSIKLLNGFIYNNCENDLIIGNSSVTIINIGGSGFCSCEGYFGPESISSVSGENLTVFLPYIKNDGVVSSHGCSGFDIYGSRSVSPILSDKLILWDSFDLQLQKCVDLTLSFCTRVAKRSNNDILGSSISYFLFLSFIIHGIIYEIAVKHINKTDVIEESSKASIDLSAKIVKD